MDRRSMELVNGSTSYAFNHPSALLHGAGAYRINLPLGFSPTTSCAGFSPQADVSVPLKPLGPPHESRTAGVQVQTRRTSTQPCARPSPRSVERAATETIG